MQTSIHTSLNERFGEQRERVFIGDYRSGGLPSAARERKGERTKGGGVLIRKTKRMFWVMIRISTEELEQIFVVVVDVLLFLVD